MRPALVCIGAIGLLAAGASSAQDSTCSVETRQVGGESFRVVRCDEDAEAISNAIADAQASCEELSGMAQLRCYEAVAASFELRRKSMIRRALAEGGTVEAVADRFDASLEEVEQVQAEMAPPERTSSAETDPGRAAIREQVEQDLAQELAQEDSAEPAP